MPTPARLSAGAWPWIVSVPLSKGAGYAAVESSELDVYAAFKLPDYDPDHDDEIEYEA